MMNADHTMNAIRQIAIVTPEMTAGVAPSLGTSALPDFIV